MTIAEVIFSQLALNQNIILKIKKIIVDVNCELETWSFRLAWQVYMYNIYILYVFLHADKLLVFISALYCIYVIEILKDDKRDRQKIYATVSCPASLFLF